MTQKYVMVPTELFERMTMQLWVAEVDAKKLATMGAETHEQYMHSAGEDKTLRRRGERYAHGWRVLHDFR